MRSKTESKKLFYFLLVLSLFVILGCGISSNTPPATKRSPSSGNPVGNSQTSPTKTPRPRSTNTLKPQATKTSSSSGSLGNTLVIPRQPQVVPSDVFDQFVFGGRGGGESGKPSVAKFDEYISLRSFNSNQEVRILLYKVHDIMQPGVFYTEFRYKVDKDGALTLYIENGKGTDFNYVVLDAKTNREITPKENDCPKLSWSQLSVNTTARITFTNGTPLRLRDSAIHGNVIRSFDEGTQLKIESGPLCSDNYIWWGVTIKGKHGWMAEGDGSERFLEPLP